MSQSFTHNKCSSLRHQDYLVVEAMRSDFDAGDIEVIRISSDSVESHKSFAQKHNLPFTLLSDEGQGQRLYGVPNTFGLSPGRVTYVIDTVTAW